MTVAELAARMTEAEFFGWVAYLTEKSKAG